MILPLVIYGDPRLRQKSAEIKEITEEIKSFASDMEETMRYANGIGLAAPQVGKNIRLFIICLDAAEYPKQVDPPTNKIQVFINPTISDPSEATVTDEEGCLSIPGIHGDVERPQKIHIKALDLDGNAFSEDVEEWKARMLMHENDHINGTLFIDRMEKNERKLLDPKINALKKKYKS